MALPIGLDRERDFDRILERIRNLCRLNNRADLLAATNALVIPEASTSHETWACYVIELGQVMQAYGVLARFQQMQTGLIALREEQRVYWSFENADIETLTVYAEATQLFYDCLQVAYTPDRRSFEERIFWLPPNRN